VFISEILVSTCQTTRFQIPGHYSMEISQLRERRVFYTLHPELTVEFRFVLVYMKYSAVHKKQIDVYRLFKKKQLIVKEVLTS
jgi:hypothetical protein